MDPDRRTATSPLTGDPPNPTNPPSGCHFRTRCGFAEAVCAQVAPQLDAIGSDHDVAYHTMVPGSGHSRAYAGRFVEPGSARDVLKRRAHPYTEGLLAANLHGVEPSMHLVTIPRGRRRTLRRRPAAAALRRAVPMRATPAGRPTRRR